jgi:hypothetical protein
LLRENARKRPPLGGRNFFRISIFPQRLKPFGIDAAGTAALTSC